MDNYRENRAQKIASGRRPASSQAAARRRAERLRRKRRRRILRRIRAYALRTLVTASITFLFLLGFRGGMKMWTRLTAPEAQASAYSEKIPSLSQASPEAFSEKPLVVLDAGHGGKDQGTHAGGLTEKDVNLAVAQKLQKELEDRGIRVSLTRSDDSRVSLEERARTANTAEADLFVSLHCNYCEEDFSIQGLECYYTEGSAGGETLAGEIVRGFQDKPEFAVRGTRTADFKVLLLTDMPAVLVELGYFSNAQEKERLTEEDYQERLAETLAESIAGSALL